MRDDLVPRNERIIRPREAEVNGVRVALRVASIVTLVALASVALGCREARAEKLYAEATALVEHGELENAVRVFEDILDRYPDTRSAERARKEIELYRGLTTAVDFYAPRKVYDLMISTAREIYRFQDRRGRWPSGLDQLTPAFLAKPAIDPWGHALLYAAKPARRGYVLGCYGSDGQRGGDGEARDWFIENGRFVQQPSVALP